MNRVTRIGLIALASFVGASATSLWQVDQSAPLVSRARFLSQLDSGHIKSVGVNGSVAYVTDTEGGFFRVVVPGESSTLVTDLQRRGVEVGIHVPPSRNLLTWLTRAESRLRFGP